MQTTAPHRGARRHRRHAMVALAAAVLVSVSAAVPASAATTTRRAAAGTSATTTRRPSPPVPGRASSTTTTLRAGRSTTTSTTRRGATTSTSTSTSSTTTTIPADLKTEIELAIVDGQRAAAPGLKVTKATCPSSLKVPRSQAKSGTFQCTVMIEGVSAPYTVVVTRPEKARTGTYELSPAKAIIDVAKVIAGIRDDLDESERATAKISCGKAKVIVAAPGVQISCTATTGNVTMPVRYTVKDLEGTIALVTE